ncbi:MULTISPECIES: FUSC family protein [Sphingomonas]|uniref:Putative membrane protein YccC n=1 Tax=Sphingomonas trueperi TaxID=53317 RepID=A0A7X5XZM9_9SPHN|nr:MULTISPECIES: FUSC family protein [Sphingomonas]NJB98324.1 putative membrane protein YccC [Sphingomonas trueperi]
MNRLRAAWTTMLGHITPRTIDAVECVVSVLLAILVAHAIGGDNVAWAAFAGYMVMRGRAGETVVRGLLRIVGTVTGGALALVLAPLVASDWVGSAIAMLAVGTLSLYRALTARRAYAWLFFGLTFAMVLLDKIDAPDTALGQFVETRILETVAGTLACMAVSIASALTVRRRWPAAPTPPPVVALWHPAAFYHAVQAGVALALLVGVARAVALPALAQSAVGVMAVMLVPVHGLGAGGLVPVSARLAQRFLGCLAGAALSALCLFLAQGHAPVLVAGTVVGVAIGRGIENGPHSYRYVGTQFTLAVLVMLVPDNYADGDVLPGIERLVAVLIGMAILEPVLLAGHWLAPRYASAEPADRGQDEPGGV